MSKCNCKNNEKYFPGKTIKEIPELFKVVTEINTDYEKWITLYECKICGQQWKEFYEAKGHGEVPSVKKI